jgi:hypothetical protein
VSLIMPYIGYEGIVYAGADDASQRRLNRAGLRNIHSLKRSYHVLHLETSVMGDLLANYTKIQLSSFLYEVLHLRLPCYLFSLFCFASSVRTRNLKVPAHRFFAMGQSFVTFATPCYFFVFL